MKPLDKYLAEVKARAAAATPGWRAGRADMQSYTGDTGIPFKALYNDRIENEADATEGKSLLEAGRIYGSNSINDSQFFAHARTDVDRLVAMVECAREALETCQSQASACGKFTTPKVVYDCATQALEALDRIASEER